MPDGSGSTSGRLRSFLLWLGAAAAVAGIVGVTFEMIDRFGSDAAPSSGTSAATGPAVANGDEQFVQAGQCVRNTGTEESPVLVIAPCGPGTQRVVARVEQAIDDEEQAESVCQQAAPDFADFHYSNWAKRSDYVDVVFCLGPA